MSQTIGNPLSWAAAAIGRAGTHMAEASSEIAGSRTHAAPIVNSLTMDDLHYALRKGTEDFAAVRSDVVFLVLLYPIIGLTMVFFAFNSEFAPYLFPLTSGFALLGPVAAVFLYEVSRRREAGLSAKWSDAVGLIRSPVMGPVVALGAYLTGVFVAWMVVAHFLFTVTMGGMESASSMGFFRDVLTTPAGWMMIAIGIPLGAVFAALVLAVTIVSFPMLIDRNVGLATAVATSLKVTRANLRVVLSWGALVATALVIGAIPFFLGYVLVLPILGHATWHLYRRAVS